MFQDINSLQRRFSELGVKFAFFKRLAENDNSKQQIYLGGSFDALQLLPFDEIQAFPHLKLPNYKAKISLFWIDERAVEQATGAQLILYPKYPEVRLSGFLDRCKLAPSEYMQPIAAQNRRANNTHDGRVLFFGVTDNNQVMAYLAPSGSSLSRECFAKIQAGEIREDGIFARLPDFKSKQSARDVLLARLTEIKNLGWHPSVKLDKLSGMPIAYEKKNGGGYTLEALFGVMPNSSGEPDFLGWELKGHSSEKISLFTPEPDGGFYKQRGAEAFVRRFGKQTKTDTLYFTGLHRADVLQPSTGLTLVLEGFDANSQKIVDLNGGVALLTDTGESAACWSFAHLMAKWNKKHAQAAYVRFHSRENPGREYSYVSPALLGEGTEFPLFISAIAEGKIVFDPGTKVVLQPNGNSSTKPRSQFRINVKQLGALYKTFSPVNF